MPQLPTPADLLTVATAAVHAAGRSARAQPERRTEYLQTFTHDVKLALDVESQGVAENVIRTAFPTHDFLGEEDASLGRTQAEVPPSEDNVQWIIDPIDGTVNFSHGMPFWCCSIAARIGTRMVAGAVYAPDLDELYTATIDGPALCNGKPIHVSATPTLDRAIVMTGMDKSPAPDTPPYAIFTAIAENTQKARIIGSAALDLCWLAAGRADGYFERGIYIWDIAAAGLIVERAGGSGRIVAQMDEPYRMAFAAANPHLIAPLCTLVNEATRQS